MHVTLVQAMSIYALRGLHNTWLLMVVVIAFTAQCMSGSNRSCTPHTYTAMLQISQSAPAGSAETSPVMGAPQAPTTSSDKSTMAYCYMTSESPYYSLLWQKFAQLFSVFAG